jgi:hypothetical protein
MWLYPGVEIELATTARSVHRDSVVVTYDVDKRTYRSRAPKSGDSNYVIGVVYPAYVDVSDTGSIRMAKDPYDRTAPLAWAWSLALLAALPLLRQRYRRGVAKRRFANEPATLMLASIHASTPRTTVVGLRSFGDPGDSFQAIALLPKRTKRDDEFPCRSETEVWVWGTLNPGDSPLLAVGKRLYIPRGRLRASTPLRSLLVRFRPTPHT